MGSATLLEIVVNNANLTMDRFNKYVIKDDMPRQVASSSPAY